MTNYLEMLILRHTPSHLLHFIVNVIDNNQFFCDQDTEHRNAPIFFRFQ